MTRPIVLDASVGVALVHLESESTRWRSLIAEWLRAGRRLIVPEHFWLEVSNALLRRHHYGGAGVLEALHVLDDVVGETASVERAVLVLAVDRAERFGLSMYDAAYLALVESLDADLATMDRALELAVEPRLADPDRPPRRLSERRAVYGDASRTTWPDYSGAASYLARLRADLREKAADRETTAG
jgi:predicted nucleic acid-binding protein